MVLDRVQKVQKRIGSNYIFLLIIGLILAIALAMSMGGHPQETPAEILSAEYFEDPTSSLDFKSIQSQWAQERFVPLADSTLRKGQTRSTFWVRMKLEDFMYGSSDSSSLQQGPNYLSVSTPTVQKVALYLPVSTKEGASYQTMTAGWGADATQDEGFTYPVFRLAETVSSDSYLYLQLTSPFTQNYSIGVMDDRTFHHAQMEIILIVGLFFGLLLAMGINNLISFNTFKDKAQLYYVFYIGLILLYHGALLGVYRIFLGPLANTLISHVITIGMVTFVFAIQFFRSFLNTKVRFPLYERIAKGVMVVMALDIVLMLAGFRYEASVASSFIGTSVAIFILTGAIKAVRLGIREARYYLAGWSFMVAGLFLLLLRVWGVLPGNTFTWIAVLLTSSIEAILLSLALSVRIKGLQEEKRIAGELLRQAEEVSFYNQSAFLQAQIKPHFLYNSFNIIATLCRIDSEKARELLLDLSSYLKHSFDFANLHQYTTLEEELEFVRAYVRIEQARFPGTIQVKYDMDEAVGLRLPPLVLQPLVENAIRHGLRKKQGRGTVTLRVVEQEDRFLIQIEDDGAGMTQDQLEELRSGNGMAGQLVQGHGVGLQNIQKRIKMIFGTELMIESAPGEGTIVSLNIPKERM